jgi:hypothetical protein
MSIEDGVIGPPRHLLDGGSVLPEVEKESRLAEFARKAGQRLVQAGRSGRGAEHAAARAAREYTLGQALYEAEIWQRNAERGVETARLEYGRTVAGVILGEASEADVEGAEAAYEQASRELRRATEAVHFLRLHAPSRIPSMG